MESKTNETKAKDCECPIETMDPKRVSFTSRHRSHICKKCNGGISSQRNIAFNKYYGYSGYDEQGEGEDEQTDTY